MSSLADSACIANTPRWPHELDCCPRGHRGSRSSKLLNPWRTRISPCFLIGTIPDHHNQWLFPESEQSALEQPKHHFPMQALAIHFSETCTNQQHRMKVQERLFFRASGMQVGHIRSLAVLNRNRPLECPKSSRTYPHRIGNKAGSRSSGCA